jgi:hypothetical protein
MLNSYIKSIQQYLLYFMLVVLFYFNFTTPLWGNILLGYGAFFQSEFYFDFPTSLYEADYIRGLVYKFLLFVIMKVTSIFVEMKNYYTFQLITKFIYYLLCFSFTYFALRLAFPRKSITQLLSKQALIWVVLLLSGYRQFMESEELAIIFTIGHFLFIYADDEKANYASGFFPFLLFGCKAVTIVYSGFSLLYWLFYINDKKKSKRIVLSHLVFLGLSILAYATIFHLEIRNILTAMAYQNSAHFNGLNTFIRFGTSMLRYLYYLPCLLIIPAGLFYALFYNRRQALFLLLTFLLASLCVIVQNRFSSPYHYLAFTPPILFIVFFSFDYDKKIISLLLVAVFVVICIQNLSDVIGYPKSSNNLYTKYFHSQSKGFAKINEYITQQPDSAGRMLYLTGDCPPYFMTIPSVNKMVGALLLNRGMIQNKLRHTPAYIGLVNDIVNYKGKYILYDPEYLPIENFPDISRKLHNLYHPVLTIHNDVQELGGETYLLYQRN